MEGVRRARPQAESLAELLQVSGYLGKVSGQGFKWAFAHPDSAAVLDWLTSQDFAAQVSSSRTALRGLAVKC